MGLARLEGLGAEGVHDSLRLQLRVLCSLQPHRRLRRRLLVLLLELSHGCRMAEPCRLGRAARPLELQLSLARAQLCLRLARRQLLLRGGELRGALHLVRARVTVTVRVTVRVRVRVRGTGRGGGALHLRLEPRLLRLLQLRRLLVGALRQRQRTWLGLGSGVD